MMKRTVLALEKGAVLAFSAAAVLGTSVAHAETPQKFYDFNSGSLGGYEPLNELLAASDGTFVGGSHGSFQYDEIFRLTSLGQIYYLTTSYAPNTLIQGSDAEFYGTEGADYYSPFSQYGSVIRVTPAGQRTALHYFNGTDGSGPVGALVQGGTNGTGAYFGVTGAAGQFGSGNIFRINSSGSFSIMHSFSALDSSGHNVDGASPEAGLVVGSDLSFYGTTNRGGAYGYGTIFKMTPQGVFTTLHSFNLAHDGANPRGALVLANDGNFYGTAENGGANGEGTVFRIAPDGTFKTIHSFSYGDGMNPASGLVEVDSGTTQYLYGTTGSGGANNRGVIYSITTGGTFQLLYSFSDLDSTGHNTEGASPNGLTAGHDGNLYATAYSGGANGYGTAFEWILQKPVVTIKVSPKSVSPGASVVLTWSSTSATSCNASGAWSGSEPLSGTQQITAGSAGSYVYTLTCTGPLGSTKKGATLTVS